MTKALEQRIRALEFRDEAFLQQVERIDALKSENSRLRNDFDAQQLMLVQLLSTFESFCSNIDAKLMDVESKVAFQEKKVKMLSQNNEKENYPIRKTTPVGDKIKEEKKSGKSYAQAVSSTWSQCGNYSNQGVFTRDIRESLQSLSLNISPPKAAKRRSDVSSVFLSDDEYEDGSPENCEPAGRMLSDLSCDICKQMCKRAVQLSCCNNQACYNCAVKYKNSMPHGERICWRCSRKMSSDPEKHLELRKRVAEFLENNPPEKKNLENNPPENNPLENNNLENNPPENKPMEKKSLEYTPLETTHLENNPLENIPLENNPTEEKVDN